jgi:hypothetical protein
VKSYESSTTIDAEPEAVWDVLTDLRRYPDWDSGITKTEGTIGARSKISIWTEVTPERAFPLVVDGLEAPRKMVWSGGLPFGLFRGVREFLLEPRDGATHVRVREEYRGPLLRLIWRTMPDLQPSFDQFTAGLKAEVERTP